MALLGHCRPEPSRERRFFTTPSKPVAEGGLNFRARFGVERNGSNLLTAEGSYPVGNELKDGHPEFTMAMLKKLGWDKDLTDAERAAIDKVAGDKTNWKTDLSGGIQRVAIKHGCAPFGNAKARTVVWTFPDPVPLHREPLYTPRRDLLPQYETYSDRKMYRLPTKFVSIQSQDYLQGLPDHSDHRAVLWNMKVAVTSHAPTHGLQNCSRTCLPKSIRLMPTTPASRTGP